ncbi:MAG: hypothetical protein ACOCUI_05090, partial [bacterium]
MKIPIVKIFHERKNTLGSGYDDGRYITNFNGLRIQLGAEEKKDTFSFNIVNEREFSELGELSFTESTDFSREDIITIYAYYQDEYTGNLDDHFIIKGIIEEIDYNTDESSSSFAIKGSNTTDSLMNLMVPALFSGSASTQVHLMIIDLIRKANATSGNTNKRINAELATVDSNGNRIGGGYVWPTKSDGSQ